MLTKIVYEDENIIVVHKPAGLATQSANISRPDVVSELKNYLKAETRGYVAVIHRLDQPVEGLLVFAKNKASAAKLSAQLQNNLLNKSYYALTYNAGDISIEEEGRLVDYMVKTPENMAKIVDKSEDSQAKKAVLNYKLEDSREKLSLFKIQLETGRFHQIRCQLSHFGFPLLGDQKYASSDIQELSRTFGIKNVMLFAYKIQFTHPKTGKKMEFELPLDKKFMPGTY